MSDQGERQIDALIAVGRYQEALVATQTALTARPDDSLLLCRLAMCMLNLQRPSDALEAAKAAAISSPDLAWSQRLISSALLRLNRPAEAITASREAIRLAPEQPQSVHSYSNALLSAGRAQEAATEAERLRALAPEWPETWNLIGRIAIDRGQYAYAESTLRHVLELDPNNGVALNNLGVALKRLGRTKEATALYRSSARVDPTMAVARRNFVTTTRNQLLGGFVLLPLALRVLFVVGHGRLNGWILGVVMLVGIGLMAGLYWYRWSRLDPSTRLAIRVELSRTRAQRYLPVALLVGLYVVLLGGLALALQLLILGNGVAAGLVGGVAVTTFVVGIANRKAILNRFAPSSGIYYS